MNKNGITKNDNNLIVVDHGFGEGDETYISGDPRQLEVVRMKKIRDVEFSVENNMRYVQATEEILSLENSDFSKVDFLTFINLIHKKPLISFCQSKWDSYHVLEDYEKELLFFSSAYEAVNEKDEEALIGDMFLQNYGISVIHLYRDLSLMSGYEALIDFIFMALAQSINLEEIDN